MKNCKIVLLIIFIGIGIGCHDSSSNTKFGLKYNERAFKVLKKGDSVDDALKTLGPPLLIQGWKHDSSSKVLDAGGVDFKNPDYSYLLVYSMQVNGRKDFERRSLLVAKGVIVEITDETVTE